jgi:hypothetical protein
VSGWYLPFSLESNVKGSPNRAKVTYQKIEANVPIDDTRFHMPVVNAGAQPGVKPPDAADTLPKKAEEKKTPAKPPTKP